MNKNKKIISTSLALALGVSLIIPNAKANEEKTVEKALKEPVKTSENLKAEEKSAVVNEKITIKKAPVKEGGEDLKDEEPKDEESKDEEPKDEEPKDEEPKDEEPKDEDPKDEESKDEEPKDEEPKDEEQKDKKPKDEQKVKPKEYKMSELLNEKGAFEKSKQAELDFLRFEIYNAERSEIGTNEEILKEMKIQYEKLPKARTWEEMAEILHYSKEYFARRILEMKIGGDAFDENLVKIIDDMANQKPQNPSQNNPNRKNKKTGTTNTANTANTGNKVNNAGENVQTGVGSLSAILGLLGASSLGLFKSKRK